MRQSDIFTVIAVAIVGVIVSALLLNMILGNPDEKSVSFKTVAVIESSLENPDPEIFNPEAINPTVEVYIGDCTAYDDRGNCIMDPDNPSPEQDEAENNPETPEENGGENEEENEEEKPEEENANREEEPENGPTD